MLDQTSTLTHRHSESEWWIRLASFAEQTGAERSLRVEPKRTVASGSRHESGKRGFRINVWRPFLSSILGSGQAS